MICCTKAGLADAVHIPILAMCKILTYLVYLCKYVYMYIVIKNTDNDCDSGQWPNPPSGQGGWVKNMKPKLSRKELEYLGNSSR